MPKYNKVVIVILVALMMGVSWISLPTIAQKSRLSQIERMEVVPDDTKIERVARVDVSDKLTSRLRVRSNTDIRDLGERLDRLSFTDIYGRNVTTELSPTITGNQLSVDTATVKEFIIKPNQIMTLPVRKKEVLELPGAVYSAEVDDRTSGGPSIFEWLRLTFLASPMPAVWNSEKESYSASVTFGLKRTSNANPQQVLDEPVFVKVAYVGLKGNEAPVIELGGPGIQNEKSFTLNFIPTAPNPILEVRSTISDTDLVLEVMPRLVLEAQSSEILGFGLETVTYSLELLQPHGIPVVIDREVPINLSIEGSARLEGSSPMFQVGPARTEFKIRSSGTGLFSVIATANGLTASDSVNKKLPVWQLILAALAGAVGGYFRRFIASDTKDRKVIWVIEGLIAGLALYIAIALCLVSVNFAPSVVASEAGAAIIGFIFGNIGANSVERLLLSRFR